MVLGLFIFSGCGKEKPIEVSNATAKVLPKLKQPASQGVPFRTQGEPRLGPELFIDQPTPGPRPPAPIAVVTPTSVRTLNGDPLGLQPKDLDQAMAGAVQRMSTCFSPGTPDPQIHLSFEAEPTGKTSLLRIKGAPSDSEHCIRGIVQNMRLPSFSGKAVPVEMPLVFHSVEYKKQHPNPKAEPVRTPTLFVQP